MHVLVTYQSKYGSTEQYAEWIATALDADIHHIDNVTEADLRAYDVVIFGSYVRVGRVTNVRFLERHWHILQSKLVVLFVTAANPTGSVTRESTYQSSVPSHLRRNNRIFPIWWPIGQDKHIRYVSALPNTTKNLVSQPL